MARKVTIEFLGEDKSLGKTMDGVDSRSSKLSGTLKKVGKAAAIGLGAGLLAGGAAMVKLTQGAIEDEKAQALLAKTLKNAAGATKGQVAAVEDWISAQGVALGVTDDELRPALQRLTEATGDVGKAQKLTSLAMDISAGTGKSLKTVSEALAKAQMGQVGGLSRYGIQTRNAAGEMMSFEEVVKKASGTFEGQAATAAGTLDGKMARLKLIVAEAGETIGSKMIPMVTTMAEWLLNEGVPAVEKFSGWIQNNLVPALSAMAEWVGKNREILIPLGGVLAGVATAIGVIAAVTKVWAAVQAVMNVVLAANPIGIVIVALAGLVAGLVITWKSSEKFRDVVTGALDKVKDVASSVAGFFKTTLPQFFRDAWDGAKQRTTNGIDAIVGWVTGIPGKISGALSSLKSTAAGLFRDAMDAGKEKVTSIGATIVGWIAEIPGKLLSKLGSFKSAGASLIGAVVDGMKNAGGVIEGIASNVWNAVRGLLNSAIDKINSALEFTISLPGPDITINPSNIPHLAKGGMVTKPTLALIGEDGPEAVVPLSRKHNPGGTMPGAGGGTTVVFNISGALDPSGVARQIETLLIQRNREVGPLAFVARTS